MFSSLSGAKSPFLLKSDKYPNFKLLISTLKEVTIWISLSDDIQSNYTYWA